MPNFPEDGVFALRGLEGEELSYCWEAHKEVSGQQGKGSYKGYHNKVAGGTYCSAGGPDWKGSETEGYQELACSE